MNTDFEFDFWHGEFFRTMDISAWDISAPEHFSTDILAPFKAIWTFQHRNFGTCATVLICPHAEMFLCQKFLMLGIPCAEKSPCRNVLVLKCPSAGPSAAPNGACAKMFP